MTPIEKIIDALKHSGPLTADALSHETDLPLPVVNTALARLRHEGRIVSDGGGFKYFNTRHSERIKLGKFVAKIPRIIDHASPTK